MYKPNTVILLTYDKKQRYCTYMIDVTSKNIYEHHHSFFERSIPNIISYLGVIAFLVLIFFVGTPRQPSTRFYLDTPSSDFKILVIAIGILIGILIYFVLRKDNQGLHIDEYLKKYPESVKITEKDEIDKIMKTVYPRVILIIVGTLGLFIFSIVVYRQFWNYHNFGSYLWATLIFIYASAISSTLKNARFVSKLHTEMKEMCEMPKEPEK